MTVNVDTIPQELKSFPNWICWSYATRKGKTTKIPYSPETGETAASNQPDTWTTFADAATYLDTYDGLGFQLSNSPYVGIDIDHCLVNGVMKKEAQQIIEQFDSYTELSPSGTGVHIFIRAETTRGHKKTFPDLAIEVYPHGRYLTMTGNIYESRNTIKSKQPELDTFLEKVWPTRDSIPTEAPPIGFSVSIPMDASSIIARIRKSQQAAAFSRLYDNGDISEYSGDESAADMALMNMLPFWTMGNIEMMREIFAMSALGQRAKWTERRDYQDMTIQKALNTWNGKYYDPEAAKKQQAEQDKFITENKVTKTPEELKALAFFRQNDTGNAERLQYLYGDGVLYCASSGTWYKWDGRRWEKTNETGLYNLVSATMRLTAMQYDTVYGPPKDKNEENRKAGYMNFFRRSENQAAIHNVIQRSRALFPISIDELDADPWALNCRNGTIDLKTGLLHPHTRKDHITKLCNAAYIPDSISPLWESTIRQIIPNDEVRAYLQKFIGYCLTGLTREEKFLFLYGEGGGGKGTFIETIGKILGDYADTIPIDVLLTARNDAGSGNEPTPQIAKMAGLRLVLTSESGRGRKFNDARLKLLTGGDKQTARFLHCEPFTFTPTGKIVMSSNYMPTVTDATDKGIKRRLIIVPFTADIETIRDITLKEKLLQDKEKQGILSWCVKGCIQWQREGLGALPVEIRKTLTDYYESDDMLGEFIDARCIIQPNAMIPTRALRRAFDAFIGNARYGIKPSIFRRDMERRGFYTHKTEKGQQLRGITLKPEYSFFLND